MSALCDIIIPTWNNPAFLNPCVNSISRSGMLTSGGARLIVVDNGDKIPVDPDIEKIPNTIVIKAGANLGWEGGLKKGLEYSNAKFVCFQNDDTLIPRSSINFYEKLITPFADDNIGIVGPTTTNASGIQSIFHPQTPYWPVSVPWVIFFCAMLRRSDLDAIGGIDDSLPGGDDFDVCMRMSQANKKIVINPNAFLIHHGFVTGTRVHGDHTVKNGWNNIEFTDKVNWGLIKKHGFKKFIENRMRMEILPAGTQKTDVEGDIVRSHVNGETKILELGCGGQKTLEKSIGVDRVPSNETIPNLHSTKSIADVFADVEKPLPFEPGSQEVIIARHILEHCINSIATIKHWKNALKIGGKLIIAVPDEKVDRSIPMNPEHVHAFTEESLSELMETLGFKTIETRQTGNGVSFVGCYEKC